MKREDKLSLDEFVTASRKPVRSASGDGTLNCSEPETNRPTRSEPAPDAALRRRTAVLPTENEPAGENAASSLEARKALRRLKRDRMKGVQSFVNVHLDRDTKKRLKLASFTSEVSMQSLMEAAIKRFLDDNGF